VKPAMTKYVMIVAAAAAFGSALVAQETPPAKLWQELEQIFPRRSGIGPAAPIGTPSAAIDWTKHVAKAEELMVRAGGTPVEPYAMYYLACFYFESGRLDEAKAIFETLRSQFGTHPLVATQLAKDGKSLVAQAIEDCASEMSWRQRHPRAPIPTPVLDPGTTATLHFSSGDVKIQFYKNVAPRHTENFIKHAQAGDYAGTKIGQVVQDALVTCGDTQQASKQPPDQGKPAGSESTAQPVPHEFANLSHTRGMVAMSRNMTSNESHGMTFQFVLKDQPYFDFTQTIFARVVEGLEVVDAISKQQRMQAPGTPSDTVLKSVTIDAK
jgi:peptidyl-prolyl cis-trans isomerase B (cyclophilin B)